MGEYEIYTDPGYSGKNLNRPAIQQLMKDIENRKIKTVVVFKLDRISRSQRDTLYLIEEVFNKYDTGFISIRESFDTTTPFGKAMIGILSVFAQLERETILERTRLGMKKRLEDGFWRGGGNLPFCYDYDKNLGILVVNPERKMIFDLMKAMRLQGFSYPQLEAITGISQANIQPILNSKTNLGLIPYKGEYFKGRHEPVITEEEYNTLQVIEKNRSKSQKAKHYLLSGKIYCGHCGAKYRIQKWGKKIMCYCYSQQKSKPKLIKDPNCKNDRYEFHEIENSFIESLFKMTLDENKFRDNFNLESVNITEELNQRINKIQIQINNLIKFISEGMEVKEATIEMNNLIHEKEEILKKITEEKNKQKKEKLYENIKNLNPIWNQLQFEEQRNITEHLLNKIVLDKSKIKIYWNIS